MKKKLLSLCLISVMVITAFSGCGSKKKTAATDSGANATTAVTQAAAKESEGEKTTDAAATTAPTAAPTPAPITTTAGDESGTHFEMWSFVELHNTFYAGMVDRWNKANPDKKIYVTFTTYPYSDMHNKLLLSLQSGSGAPDLCDVEIGQFPNIVNGEDKWLYPMENALAPYKDSLVPARIEVYSKNGHNYGIPFHVGATVMYYNLAEMEKYGITQADIDAVETWDDYEALGKKYVAAVGQEGKYFTSVDTGGTDWLWLAMAEYGEDWTGGENGTANVELQSVKNMLTMQQKWLQEKIAEVSPDGHVDLEAGFQNILDHNIVSFPKAMWYMSRFTNYMAEEKGNWYLAKCPVFEKGQNCSVGIGGTGTVVTQQSKNAALAAEFLCYAKCSLEGEEQIWDQLGFDVCNTAMWTDEKITRDTSNQYIAFFKNNPFDVLNAIKNNIGKISVVKISPTINEQICTTTLNEVLEQGMSVDDALKEAQDAIALEQ